MEQENVKHIIDIMSIAGVIATFIGWLPFIAAGLSAIWTCIRIYETKTFQNWLKK